MDVTELTVTMDTSIDNVNTTNNTDLVQDILFSSQVIQWLWVGEITYLTIIFTIGTVGNCLVILVELQNKIKYSTDYLVIAMSTFEVLCATLGSARHVMEYTPAIWDSVKSTAFCQFSWLVGYTTGMSSPVLLTAISIDRYILTCKPLTQWYDVRTGKYLAIVLSLAIVVLGFPSGLAVHVDEVLLCEGTSDWINLEMYTNVLIFVTFLSFFIIIISYIMIGRTIHQRNRQRRANQPQTTSSDFGHSQSESRTKSSRFSFRRVFNVSNKIEAVHARLNTNKDIEQQEGRGEHSTCTVSFYISTDQSTIPDDSNKTDKSHTQTSTRIENNSVERYTKSHKAELMRRTTLITFVITVTYAITYFSAWTLFFVSWSPVVIHYLFHLTALLSMFNCASNPAYFFLLSSKFRQTAKKIVHWN